MKTKKLCRGHYIKDEEEKERMEDLMKKLEKAVKSAVGTEYEVDFCETRKNNGVVLKSVSICKTGKSVMQKIHINEILEMITLGRAEINEAAGMIAKICREHEREVENLEQITCRFSKVEILDRVTGQMVNKAANARMLMEVPHKIVLDLALIYRVMLQESECGTASFLAGHTLCAHYGISIEELDNAASANMIRERFTTRTMESVLAGMAALPDGMDASACPMLVITNNRRLYGAAVMAHPEYFESLSAKTGTDLYILPSSIHEVIVVPAEGMEPDELRKMVMEVNASELDREEFLSDNVYKYSRKTGGITIV